MSDIALEINGIPYSGFISATASKSMEHISGEFSFEVSALNDLEKFPIKLRSKCRVLIDNKPFITGYIEKVRISKNANEHKIIVGGRDRTCDVVDSSLGNELSFTAGITLQEITKKTLTALGLQNDIKIISKVDDLDAFDETDINNIDSQCGETCFYFIEKYAKKRQILIMSDGDGNIVFARTPDPKKGAQLKTVLTTSGGYQGTIFDTSIDFDDTKRFYKYVLKSQKNESSNVINSVSDIDNEKTVSVGAIAYDEKIRTSRIHTLTQTEDSYNSQSELQDRATYESNYRMAKGFTYSITVQGFSPINDPGVIWQPNYLITVTDLDCDIAEGTLLLIKSVKFSQSLDAGSTTTLELVDKDGYSVEVLQGIKYKHKHEKKKGVGGNIINDVSQIPNI